SAQTVFSSLNLLKNRKHPFQSKCIQTSPCRSRPTRLELNMKKYAAFTLLLTLLVITALTSHAQTRPRRAETGANGNGQPTQPSQTNPARPVLRGAYPNSQRPTDSKPAEPSGPVEVDAGDIIRVNTTLVTIPVSVMDRDGRY